MTPSHREGMMHKRMIASGIEALGAVDWDRRLFDALIPLPDGTSYNAYLIRGTDKTALLDTVDPDKTEVLIEQLADVGHIDYLVCHHAEQDHSGAIPAVLAAHPETRVVASAKCQEMLFDLLGVPPDRVMVVKDNDTLELGGRSLRFLALPWVHWPETIVSWLEPEGILFSCDLFGSHLATTDLFARPDSVLEPAKRYYAEIMMPFAGLIRRHLQRLEPLPIRMIAPSHGPLFDHPDLILSAYRAWVDGPPENRVLLPFVSMHGSTLAMVEHLTSALAKRAIGLDRFDLVTADLGRLAMSLVDAATIVVASPTVLGGMHPLAVSAAYLINALKPKARFASFMGSHSWSARQTGDVAAMLPSLSVEVLPPVLVKGLPKAADFVAIDALADAIATRHANLT